MKTGQQLQTRLQANARPPAPIDIYLKLWRRTVLAIRRRLFKTSFKYHLASGGAMIAIVGGVALVVLNAYQVLVARW